MSQRLDVSHNGRKLHLYSKNRWTHHKYHYERLDDSNNESTLVTKSIMNDWKKMTIHEWTQFTQNGRRNK